MQTKGQLMKSLHTAFSFAPPSILSLTICGGDCGIVNDRKEGKWHYYSLDKKVIREASSFVEALGR